MADPGVGAWHELGIAFASENNVDSHEAQGMATDGTNWYLSSNGSKRIIIYDQHWNRLFTVSPTDTVWDAMRNDAGQPSEDWGHGEENPHFGALCVHELCCMSPGARSARCVAARHEDGLTNVAEALRVAEGRLPVA